MAEVKLTDTDAKKLYDFIEEELRIAENEVYNPLMSKYNALEDTYAGVVEERSADWMSNFPVLMGATFVDSVTARIVNTIEAFKPSWSLEPTRDSGWTKVARETERLLDYKARMEMNFLRELRKSLFDMTRLGMGAMLTPWVTETKTVKQESWIFNRTTEITTKDWVQCIHLPIRDLMYPSGYGELELLPWWARKLRWTPMELEVQKRKKYYDHVDDVMAFKGAPESSEAEAAEREGLTLGQSQRIHGREVHIKWDLKGKGDLQRYIVTIQPDKRVIMRIEEDTYPEWMLRIFRYGPRSSDLHGLGITEITKPFDDALYALYNLLVDNFKVATMQCLKGKKGTGLRADTKIYPGKLFLMSNPLEDLVAMPMGNAFAMNPSFPKMIWELGERRAGVSDYALGRESSATSKATATGTLALIQEGQRRFDLTISDTRRTLSGLGMFTLAMMHERLPQEVPYQILGDKGEWVTAFLKKPSISPYLALNVVSNLSNVTMNKEIRKQDAIATFQLLAQYYQTVPQFMMMMSQEGIPDEAKQSIARIIIASAAKLKQVLEAHGEMAPEQYTEVAAPMAGAAGNEPPAAIEGGGEM